jgi:hypothetical protein
MNKEVKADHIANLDDLLTPDQLKLMLELLGRIYASGFGELAIVIKDRKVRFFHASFSIPALPVSRNE